MVCVVFFTVYQSGKETNAIPDFVVDDEVFAAATTTATATATVQCRILHQTIFLTVGSKTKKNNDWTDIDGCAVAPIWDGPYGYWCGQNLWMDCWAPNRSIQWP